MAKSLCVEEPYLDAKYMPWDDAAKRRFDRFDIELLERGDVVWQNGTAYSLEEDEEVSDGTQT